MWIVAWTEDSPEGPKDFYLIVANEEVAFEEYQDALETSVCACMAPIAHATEPHWVEGE